MTTKAKSAYVAHATFIVAVVAAILVPWLLVPLYVVGVIYAYRGYRYDVSSPISSTWATMYSAAICWSLFDHVTQYLSVRATIGENATWLLIFSTAVVLLCEALLRGLYADYGAPHVNRQIDKFVRS